ncbi:uncharacterized protein SRS1_11989 [Sporisorium reilianum f. sp. reilianum]|uniref:C2H2-type domain-containing protein n=1 Tax=Sporisorium reilianum f. sp. reilianum TaxID=72559 RepID=A0A2N8U8Z3_9BASI|nr:uncharacterized protein SRS1_11989 [Sporisorium reilianum f. sp. reilianum]
MDCDPTLWPGGDRLSDAAGSLSARSSSAPPNRSFGFTQIGRSDFAGTADAITSTNLDALCADEWDGSHVSVGSYGNSETTSTGGEQLFMVPNQFSSGGHHLAQGELVQSNSGKSIVRPAHQPSNSHVLTPSFVHLDCGHAVEGNRTHGLPSLTVSYGTDLTTNLEPPFDTRFPNANYFNPTAEQPMLSYPSLAGNRGFGLTRSTDAGYRGDEQTALDHHHSASIASQEAAHYHLLHEVQQQALPSRARDVFSSGLPASACSRIIFSPDTGESEGEERVFQGHEWPQIAMPSLHGQEDTPGLQFVDVSSHYGPNGRQNVMGEPTSNPMWGLAYDHPLSLLGAESRDFHATMELGGYESLATSGTTSSLGSSQSLPGSTLTSNDAWLSRDGGESLQDRSFSGRDRTEASASARGIPSRSVSFESSFDQGRNSSLDGQGSNLQLGPNAALGSNGEVTSASLAGGRIEEGCIGSKRRIWYRAPNGQFASVTQALTGQFAGDGNGNNGQGGSTSNAGIRRIRRRRKSEEVERKYRCDYDGCDKAYGTLNRKYMQCARSKRFACRVPSDTISLFSPLPSCTTRMPAMDASDLNTHRATNDHGPRLNAVGVYDVLCHPKTSCAHRR